jgi:Condensation domain
VAATLSEIRVGFDGDGAGTGELTWGQLGIWRTARRTGRTMNIVVVMPLARGSSLAEVAAALRFMVTRHPALRTRLRFADGSSGDRRPRQVVAGSGEVPLQVADIGDGDDPAAAAEEMRSRYELDWFDYENEFPVRMGVIRQSGALAAMVVGYSHVMVDGNGLGALFEDLEHRDRGTGEATAPPEGLSPLELARTQGSASGRRQSERAIQYWAAQLGRLPAWKLAGPASVREPRFAELVACSPALELGMRAVAARTGAGTGDVLLAAYSVAVARVFGRSPSVAQVVVSNRFRPGLAGLVSQVSQHGICVVDTAGASFGEVVARARKAATSASFYGYYDPAERDRVIDEADTRRGQALDISWTLNDRRDMFESGSGGVSGGVLGGVLGGAFGGGVPTAAQVRQVLPHTTLYWDRGQPTFDGTLFLQVDSEPPLASRRALGNGLPAAYLEVWTDTHLFALERVEAFVREMEAVVVAAV